MSAFDPKRTLVWIAAIHIVIWPGETAAYPGFGTGIIWKSVQRYLPAQLGNVGATRVEPALLKNLLTGAGSNSQFIGGLVVALLYVVIGLLSAIGSILVVRRIFQGRWEQIFWASFLVVIAAFYLSFAAYFGVSTQAWQTELVVVVAFLFCGVSGLFFRPVIAVGYVMHGLWDLSHSLSGSSLAGLSLTAIPLGYGIFCSTYDFVVACYLTISDTKWHEPGKLDFYFWRHIQ